MSAGIWRRDEPQGLVYDRRRGGWGMRTYGDGPELETKFFYGFDRPEQVMSLFMIATGRLPSVSRVHSIMPATIPGRERVHPPFEFRSRWAPRTWSIHVAREFLTYHGYDAEVVAEARFIASPDVHGAEAVLVPATAERFDVAELGAAIDRWCDDMAQIEAERRHP